MNKGGRRIDHRKKIATFNPSREFQDMAGTTLAGSRKDRLCAFLAYILPLVLTRNIQGGLIRHIQAVYGRYLRFRELRDVLTGWC